MKNRNIFYFFLGAVLVATGLYGLSVGNLTSFTAGTPIRASEVNTNFSVLRSAIEALEAPVDTARLADRAVTPAKMADQGCPAGQALGGYNDGNPNCVAVQGGAGLTEVARDATLTGNGTAASPLSLADRAVTGAKMGNGPFILQSSGNVELELREQVAGGVPQMRFSKLNSPASTWDIAVSNNLNWLFFDNPSDPNPAPNLILKPSGDANFAGQVNAASFGQILSESTGAPQLELRETNAGQFSQLRLSVQGNPNFWDIAARDVLNIYREGTGNVVSLQTNGDMNLTGDISQPRDKDGTTKASALINCGATPSVARSFNQVTGTITVEGGTAGICTVDFGFNVSDRFWQVSSYKVSGTTGIDPQIVNCEFSLGLGTNKLTCVVRSITTGNVQVGSFMITVF
ncbi:hypothetical protein [Meiothermus sp.]|uniref:hypothetical protein n=1 Tax=Meiothermus sp. TaxID=1955249 RepID=UPI0021DBEA16|nr:hypothetical protein [Meiothermus sp.]GIW26351.1 MAG: hypothetical protein KatS3mg069_2618 [Meiothermus sp.]